MEHGRKGSMRRPITLKKMETILHLEEAHQQEKKYRPGEVDIENSPFLTLRVVNFFGDVSTEVFTIKANVNNHIAAVGCSNGEAKVYDIYEGKVLKIGNTSRLSGYPTTGVSWKPRSTEDFVACNCDGTIKWYNSNKETAYGHC
jgi:WD40 repeat protein